MVCANEDTEAAKGNQFVRLQQSYRQIVRIFAGLCSHAIGGGHLGCIDKFAPVVWRLRGDETVTGALCHNDSHLPSDDIPISSCAFQPMSVASVEKHLKKSPPTATPATAITISADAHHSLPHCRYAASLPRGANTTPPTHTTTDENIADAPSTAMTTTTTTIHIK
nr:unnamed protein product [Spirometra erinaceieuropaei]